MKATILMQPLWPVETVQFIYIEGSHYNATILSYGNDTIRW
jgi:hypothetical protein